MTFLMEQIGSALLYLGDCEEVLPTLQCVDAVVTDPPYGIGEHGGACRTRGRPGYSKHENLKWDDARPEKQLFEQILSLASETVIWGGNYFADFLPPTMGWFYWRKLMGGDFSDGELAWTSRNKALKEFVKCPKSINKDHPCQKPVELMEWCISLLNHPKSVLDPFMGSGTTGIACTNLGVSFVGIERERKYFDVACLRIDAAHKQQRLFK